MCVSVFARARGLCESRWVGVRVCRPCVCVCVHACMRTHTHTHTHTHMRDVTPHFLETIRVRKVFHSGRRCEHSRRVLVREQDVRERHMAA